MCFVYDTRLWPSDKSYLRPLNENVYSLKILRSQKHVTVFYVWYCVILSWHSNAGMLEMTCGRVFESLFSGSLIVWEREMLLAMKINVSIG